MYQAGCERMFMPRLRIFVLGYFLLAPFVAATVLALALGWWLLIVDSQVMS